MASALCRMLMCFQTGRPGEPEEFLSEATQFGTKQYLRNLDNVVVQYIRIPRKYTPIQILVLCPPNMSDDLLEFVKETTKFHIKMARHPFSPQSELQIHQRDKV
jgi:hypothetical protein